jgi:diacylglycerol kinase family enzyme
MTIEYDDSVIKGDFIFGGVINSTSVAGFIKLNPEYVDLADGKFEVVLVKQPIGLPDFLDIMSGLTVGTYDGDNFQVLHASRVKFIFEEEVAWAVDGESGGMHKEVEITNCHKAIEIVM